MDAKVIRKVEKPPIEKIVVEFSEDEIKVFRAILANIGGDGTARLLMDNIRDRLGKILSITYPCRVLNDNGYLLPGAYETALKVITIKD